METATETRQSILSIIANVERTTTEIAGAFGPIPTAKDDEITSAASRIMAEMYEIENRPETGVATVSLERLITHVAFARGCIEVVRQAMRRGETIGTDRLDLADLFLHYATLDIAAVAQLAEIVGQTEDGKRARKAAEDCLHALAATVDDTTGKDGRTLN